MNEETPKKQTLWFVGADYDHRTKEGGPRQSDKVYVIELYPDGISPGGRTMWSVKASWGRRGKHFQSQIKRHQYDYFSAEWSYRELLLEKIRKGYKKWEFVVAEEEMHMETDWNS